MQFVLVHSPLVGPATWRWVAAALRSAGHEVVVPDLREAAESGRPQAVIDAALSAIEPTPVLVVGHSGAGAFLPAIVARFRRPPRPVFVDAGIPPCSGPATASADFLDQLRALAVAGTLPKWSTWWGEGVMETLVPDRGRRASVVAEMPEVPLALYETPIDLPVGWCATPAGVILLTEAYRHDANRARSLGWPLIERIGNHLDIVNDPDTIAHDLVALASSAEHEQSI